MRVAVIRAALAVVAAFAVGAVLTSCSPGGGAQSGLQVSDLSASASASSTDGSPASSSSGPSSGAATSVASSGSGASSTAGPSGSAAPTTPAAPSGSAGGSVAVLSLPPVVAGYTYSDPPATATAAFSKLAGAYPGVFGVPVVRTVRQEPNSVGTVGFLPLSAASRTAGTEEGIVRGLVEGMSGKGYTITTLRVGVHTLVQARSNQATIVAWYYSGVVAVVTTTNPPPRPVAFATAALA